MKSKNTERRCIFCRFWRGAQAQPIALNNHYEFSNSEKGKCIKKYNHTTSACFFCHEFELDSYKYPSV